MERQHLILGFGLWGQESIAGTALRVLRTIDFCPHNPSEVRDYRVKLYNLGERSWLKLGARFFRLQSCSRLRAGLLLLAKEPLRRDSCELVNENFGYLGWCCMHKVEIRFGVAMKWEFNYDGEFRSWEGCGLPATQDLAKNVRS